MNLKYAAELRARPDQPCPCLTKFSPRSATVYRFLHREATEADFEPRPESVLKPKCCHYAVSFFDSIENAQKRYRSLASVNDDGGISARLKYGDHIGELNIGPADGLMDLPNSKSGHMELHPAAGALFATRVTAYTPCSFFETDDAA